MWAADRVVAPTTGSAITIPETVNEFAIKEAPNSAVGGIFLYKTLNQAYQLLEDKVLLKLDWAKNQKPKPSLKKTVSFADKGRSNSGTDKIMARMNAKTMKMDAQYKEMQSCSNHSIPEYDEDDNPCLLKLKENSCKPFYTLVFIMIIVTMTQTAIIGVRAEEMIIIEITIDPILMINLMIFKNS
ncbi:hypothetical protein Tco_0413178 [Tanacetum coccineum]